MDGTLSDLAARIQAHLAAAGLPGTEVLDLEAAAGGACQENFTLSLKLPGEAAPRRMLFRSDAESSLPGSLNRAAEYAVISAATAAEVRTPAAHWPGEGLLRDGSHGYFLDFVAGEAIGRKVLRFAASSEENRRGLVADCARELARIHTVTPRTHPDLFADDGGWRRSGDPVTVALEFQRALLDRARAEMEAHPALELIHAWLVEHRPEEIETVLVHGDFRTGNLMVTEAGFSALLDWEFAHWGSPAEDLGWLCMRDWRFGQLGRPCGGFGSRAELYDAYAEASGREVDPAAVHYWEIFANLRWGTGCVFQGLRYLSGQQSDLELLAIARRCAEMEYEGLRMIDRGPQA